jgi:hypothetical protein
MARLKLQTLQQIFIAKVFRLRRPPMGRFPQGTRISVAIEVLNCLKYQYAKTGLG